MQVKDFVKGQESPQCLSLLLYSKKANWWFCLDLHSSITADICWSYYLLATVFCVIFAIIPEGSDQLICPVSQSLYKRAKILTQVF